MSAELNRARSQLSSIKTLLKQDKLLPAVMSLQEALVVFLKNQSSLLKAERSEFLRLIDKSVHTLNTDAKFKQVCPILLEYEEGKEKELYSTICTILKELQGSAVEEAKKQLADLEQSRKILFEKGLHHLERSEVDQAREVFDKLIQEYMDDTELKLDVSEAFAKKGYANESGHYLKMAFADKPDSVHLFNRMGMILRRLKKFEEAEKCYQQALQGPPDEYLLFNLGRVYIDWKKWDKAAKAAQMALKLDDGFKEARMMLDYAKKKIAS